MLWLIEFSVKEGILSGFEFSRFRGVWVFKIIGLVSWDDQDRVIVILESILHVYNNALFKYSV